MTYCDGDRAQHAKDQASGYRAIRQTEEQHDKVKKRTRHGAKHPQGAKAGVRYIQAQNTNSRVQREHIQCERHAPALTLTQFSCALTAAATGGPCVTPIRPAPATYSAPSPGAASSSSSTLSGSSESPGPPKSRMERRASCPSTRMSSKWTRSSSGMTMSARTSSARHCS